MRSRALLLSLLLLAPACGRRAQARQPGTRPAYPPAPIASVVDEHHGVVVADPFRPLEDAHAETTQAWIRSQQALTEEFLAAGRTRARIRRRLEEIWDYERTSLPVREGGRYFFERNDGLQAQEVLCVTESLGADPRVLLDPNTLSPDGTTALRDYTPSRDGRYLAYALSEGGSDWRTMRVREVDTGEDLPADVLTWIKFSDAAWLPDGSGFYYSRMPAPEAGEELTAANVSTEVCFHRLGTSQEEDEVVYARPDLPEWSFFPGVTEDGRYLVLEVSRTNTAHNGVFVRDLQGDGTVLELLRDFDADYSLLGNDGGRFYVWTDRDAPRGRVVAIDLAQPAPARWTTLVPEGDCAMQWVTLVGDRFFVQSLVRAHSRVTVHGLDGRLERTLALPGFGATWGFRGQRADHETFFRFSSFTVPPRNYRYDLESGATELLWEPSVDFDPEAFEAKQVAYRSKDGVWVTMFVCHRTGLRLDGANPTLLNGYGGFGISMLPRFSPALVAWLEMGGVYALPNLRGGGEYGEAWHRAGMREHKQAVFDDFIAAAETLIENGYTSPARLAISGGSNGGLLVGAVMTQRPELFGACLPSRGLYDMLRFERFTVGRFWSGEYGTVDDPETFRVLYAYSPYHHVRTGTHYPPTLVKTADRDDRVVPAHSYKFVAALQACQAGTAPILLRVEERAGHGGGTPTQRRIAEVADDYTFLARALRMRVPRGIG